jgi:hypothetical protein
MQLSLKRVIILIMGVFSVFFLTSCKTAKIIDLINQDTNRFYEDYDLSDQALEQYKINDVLFIPYTVHNTAQSYKDKFDSYKLILEVYRKDNDNSKIIINHVAVEGIKEVKFKRIAKTLNKTIKLNNLSKGSEFQTGEIVLLEEINTYNMELKDNSQIKVILNISVIDGIKTINKDIEYIFQTNTREYLLQR